MNARRLRFPVLIGAGVIAAGVLLYQSNSRIDSSQTRGEIAQRDVYRDSQVNPEDVNATPGNAPVAAKVLLESKEFKALANNPAYHDLLASASFEVLAHNQQFLAMLTNPSFVEMSKSEVFAHYLKNEVLAESSKTQLEAGVAQGTAQEAKKSLEAGINQDSAQEAKKSLDANLAAASAAELGHSKAFHDLQANASFQSILRAQELRAELARVVSNGSFSNLVHSSELQGLLAGSQFREAMRSDLSANIKQSATKK